MAKVYFTLENVGIEDGAEATFPDWGVDDFSLVLANQAVDTCDLFQKGRRYDAAFLFPYKSTVILRAERLQALDGSFSGGYILFRGLVQYPRAMATARTQAQQCTLVGPGWYLAERAFEQEYKELESITLGVPTYKSPNPTRSRVFLNLALGEYGQVTITKLTLGEQLKQILDWVRKPFVDAAITAPFQYDSGELLALATDPPVDEVKNITCEEAARKMYRWIPDVVQWFDYTTTPPTFHAQRRAALPAHNLDVRVTRPTALNISPRLDLQRPYVKIQYEIRDSLEGVERERTIYDFYPDPLPTDPLDQFAGVPFVVDLRGYTRVTAPSVSIRTQTIDTGNAAWWLSNLPEYADALEDGRITSITFDFTSNGTPQSSIKIKSLDGAALLGLPRQLVEGQPSDAIAAQWQRCSATIKAKVVMRSGATLEDKTFSFQFTATDAVTGTYGGGASVDEGDPVPVGLAQDFYTAINGLQHQGSLSFTDKVFSPLPKLGEKLNLVGTATAGHATMAALIQRVTQTGRTRTVEFGPPPHLDVGDLISLLRVSRNRDPKNPYSIRVGGGGSGGAGTGNALRSVSALNNSNNATGNASKVVASGSTDPENEEDEAKMGLITLSGPDKRLLMVGGLTEGEIDLRVGPDEGKTWGEAVRLRWTKGCDDEGNVRYALMLRSPLRETLPEGASLA
jgi:hypothetical protein